ncbi:MAG: hypothetical protein RLZZ511_3179 [Cyanobacteriota bacterium]
MVGPLILAGVKKGLLRLGFGSGGGGEVVATAIASGTGEGQVFCVITATERLWEEMVEGEQGRAAGF